MLSTRLYYVHKDIQTKTNKIKISDGEVAMNNQGGIGKFGSYGDTIRNKIIQNKWHRIAITVKCKDPPDKKKKKKSGTFGNNNNRFGMGQRRGSQGKFFAHCNNQYVNYRHSIIFCLFFLLMSLKIIFQHSTQTV